MPLYDKLVSLRPKLAKAAQRVVDEWAQDEDGFDEELGEGGPCDLVAQAMANVIAGSIKGIDITEGGQDGDDHAFIVVYDDKDAFAVDIPPGVYETGGGYRWTKRKDAFITPNVVLIERVRRGDIVGESRGQTKRRKSRAR